MRRFNPLRHRWRYFALMAVFSAANFFASFASAQANTKSVLESDLRAAVIVGILRFTDWDQSSLAPKGNSPLMICTWGNAPSVQGLEQNQTGIRIRDQALQLRHPKQQEELSTCPIVIWGKQTESLPATTLISNALVICDDCDRDKVIAIINLVRVGNRIQFEINLNRARLAGINFSSNLLDLARRVEGL